MWNTSLQPGPPLQSFPGRFGEVYTRFRKGDEEHLLAHPVSPQRLLRDPCSPGIRSDGSFLQLYLPNTGQASGCQSSLTHLPGGRTLPSLTVLFALGLRAAACPVQTWVWGMAAAQTLPAVTSTALSSNKEDREPAAVLRGSRPLGPSGITRNQQE